VWYEKNTTKDCLFPETAFKDFTTGLPLSWTLALLLKLNLVMILLISFLHNFAFNAGTFYLALYFQARPLPFSGISVITVIQQAVNGSTPFNAGLDMLPYSLGSSLASMPVAWFINTWQFKTGDTTGQNLVTTVGLLLSTLGFGGNY
jgi:hypothetical protein